MAIHSELRYDDTGAIFAVWHDSDPTATWGTALHTPGVSREDTARRAIADARRQLRETRRLRSHDRFIRRMRETGGDLQDFSFDVRTFW